MSSDLSTSFASKLQDVTRDFRDNLASRMSFLSYVLYLAKANWIVDNRAYLYALAIDLYNSLPPDNLPNGTSYYLIIEKKSIPYKRQFYNNLFGEKLINENGAPNRNNIWHIETEVHTGSEQVTAFVEKAYIENYLLATAKIDEVNYSASMNPENISLRNPTYYLEIKKYLEENRGKMESHIPPWK